MAQRINKQALIPKLRAPVLKGVGKQTDPWSPVACPASFNSEARLVRASISKSKMESEEEKHSLVA